VVNACKTKHRVCLLLHMLVIHQLVFTCMCQAATSGASEDKGFRRLCPEVLLFFGGRYSIQSTTHQQTSRCNHTTSSRRYRMQ